MSTSAYVVAVAIGIAYIVGVRLFSARRAREKTRKNFPEQMDQWYSLDRRTRKSLSKAMDAGLAIPAEHAAAVIAIIDMGLITEGRIARYWRRMVRAYGFFLAFLLIAVLLLVIASNAALRFIPVVMISMSATLLLWQTVDVLWVRKRTPCWRENFARTREKAVRDLEATATTTSG
jgi:hypothetical protein